MRPSKKLADVEVSSIKKKLKDKGFAAQVDREQIRQCEELLGLPLDEFVGSDIGKKQVGIPECAYGDYGYDVNPGDRIAGGVATAKGKVNLKGEFFPDGDDRGVYLSEPYHGDGGDVADLDHVSCHGEECGKTPWPCVYAVPGREEMIPAVEYGLPNYDVTRDDHDGVQAAGFKSEDAAEAFIAAKIKAGEGEDWEWNIVEVPCPYA